MEGAEAVDEGKLGALGSFFTGNTNDITLPGSTTEISNESTSTLLQGISALLRPATLNDPDVSKLINRLEAANEEVEKQAALSVDTSRKLVLTPEQLRAINEAGF